MWLLRRRNKAPIKPIPVPEEIKAYYEAEQKQQSWRLWALSAATFTGTLAIVLLLFFGGRALYQNFKDSKNQPKNTANTTIKAPAASSNKPSNSTPSGQSTPSTTPPATSPPPAPQNASSHQLIDTGPGNVDE